MLWRNGSATVPVEDVVSIEDVLRLVASQYLCPVLTPGVLAQTKGSRGNRDDEMGRGGRLQDSWTRE